MASILDSRLGNLLAMEKTSHLKPVAPASPKTGKQPQHRRPSRTASIDLCHEFRKTNRATDRAQAWHTRAHTQARTGTHLSLQMGSIYSPIQSAESQLSPRDIFQLIPGKLSLAFHPSKDFSTTEIKRRPDLFFFSTDLHERYLPFCEDFGPVNIGIIYMFWQYVRSKEHHPDLRKRPMVYYTFMEPQHQINAAFLLGTYMMLEHNMPAAAAAGAIERIPNILAGFRDATYCEKDFEITIRDCCMGLQRALQVGWFNTNTFHLALYEELEKIGDLSLIGNKFVAFRGPRANPENDDWVRPPKAYRKLFRQLEVTTVIRLNEVQSYDKEDFEKEGFEVHDLEFADCSCPTPAKIKRFLDIVDSAPGRVAVHCKAGLGRTGTMIALWMMKNRSFSAREAIAWLRLCRPGSVIGPQQHFLVACESMVWEGNVLLPFADSRSKQVVQCNSPLEWTTTARPKSLPPWHKLGQTAGSTPKEVLAKQVERGSRMRSLLKSESKTAALAPRRCDTRKQISTSSLTGKTAFEAPRTCSVAA